MHEVQEIETKEQIEKHIQTLQNHDHE